MIEQKQFGSFSHAVQKAVYEIIEREEKRQQV